MHVVCTHTVLLLLQMVSVHGIHYNARLLAVAMACSACVLMALPHHQNRCGSVRRMINNK